LRQSQACDVNNINARRAFTAKTSTITGREGLIKHSIEIHKKERATPCEKKKNLCELNAIFTDTQMHVIYN